MFRSLMTSVPGTVEAVHMVSVTPEGSKLFSADIIVENESPDGGYGGVCHRHCER